MISISEWSAKHYLLVKIHNRYFNVNLRILINNTKKLLIIMASITGSQGGPKAEIKDL